MIISPPFLPAAGAASGNADATDPMMDAVDMFELAHGVYPIAFDRRWHTGVHLMPDTQNERVRAIADGEVVAYRVCQKAIDGGEGVLDSNAGFVLLKHKTETGDGRSITFYSLYMHLLDLDGYTGLGVQVNSLPEFLRTPTSEEGQSGGGKKVYRKDVLGLPGACHGMHHMHFEIFMLPGDFTAYVNSTQLDNKNTTTPTNTDYWGHTYYIIPANQQFVDSPPGVDNGKLNGIAFDKLQGGSNQNPLHIETYFHKGSRYTNTWSVGANGTRTLLTSQPVKEAGYEYTLYTRATKLYPRCPSDGYELLRFGRILSDHPTLSNSAIHTPPGVSPDIAGNPNPVDQANPSAAWIRVTYAQGKEGYIDVNDDSIVKLSDADFPFFTGWTKISDANTPYTDDGLCDVDELKKILGSVLQPVVNGKDNEYQDEDALCNYILGDDAVRTRLKGFICEAPTEWDSAHNDTRYAKLNDPDGFYGKQKDANPTGYSDFLTLLKKFQFWDKTGLPEGKLWYFHPLRFIRHFRKCGWLSMPEFKQLLPTEVLREGPHHAVYYENIPNSYASGAIPTDHRVPLNKVFRKYSITAPDRMAALLGNSMQETQWFTKLHENNSSMWYYPWDGRGFLQLTHPENYITYCDFRGREISQTTRDALARAKSQANAHRDHAQTYIADSVSGVTPSLILWRQQVGAEGRPLTVEDMLAPSDSAGFYWSMMKMAQYADRNISLERREVSATQPPNPHHPDASNSAVTKIYYHSAGFRDASAIVNLPSAVGHENAPFNGYIARCVAYAQALAVLSDIMFPDASGTLSLIFPEGRSPRRT
ncbi:putative chitinase [Paraburkholderia sp. GAS206C]|jgi:predicted chitinase|uniref:hypothetical protein n=1 Tax=unclassified Paraburkholderia TaxID=2615204 RepID=UPI003D1D2E1F